MIRRFYILPLRHGVPDGKVQEFIDVLRAADRFIPGLRDSSADIDFDSRTVLWENTFVDEATYAGPYMVHPYHVGAIDNYVMADSPECLTQDIYVMRYQTPDATQRLRSGVRRVVLMNIAEDADPSLLASLAAEPDGMATSAFGADNVGWVSPKGRAWTHVWEQGFTDAAQLQRYLESTDGRACSSREGFDRLGVHVGSLKVFTCPFNLNTVEQQATAATPPDDEPVLYTITARLALDQVDRYTELLESLYDPFLNGLGGTLLHRWRTVAHGYLEAEVHSTWQIRGVGTYSDIRIKSDDPRWIAFVRDAMPLVLGGARRFHRAV